MRLLGISSLKFSFGLFINRNITPSCQMSQQVRQYPLALTLLAHKELLLSLYTPLRYTPGAGVQLHSVTCTRWRWAVTSDSSYFTPGSHWIRGWVGPRFSQDRFGKEIIPHLWLHSKLGPSSRKQSLYCPHYHSSNTSGTFALLLCVYCKYINQFKKNTKNASILHNCRFTISYQHI
jgi:hypothetical protein